MGYFRKTKIQNFESAILGDHQVAGLQVTSKDFLLVCYRQPFRRLHPEFEDFALRQRPACQLLLERNTWNELHHQEIHIVLDTEPEHGFNIRGIEFCESECFFTELLSSGIIGESSDRGTLMATSRCSGSSCAR